MVGHAYLHIGRRRNWGVFAVEGPDHLIAALRIKAELTESKVLESILELTELAATGVAFKFSQWV